MEIGIGTYALLYTQLMGNKELLYSTGKSIRNSLTACIGKEFEKEWLNIFIHS